MENQTYALTEITEIVQHIVARADCEVLMWRYDPRDARWLFITAQLQPLILEAKPVQLEVLLPPRRKQVEPQGARL